MTKTLKKKPIEASEIDTPQVEGNLRVVGPTDLDQRDPLEHEFKLKSEFFEKNVKVPAIDKSQNSESITQVKVYRENGIDVVDPMELKKFIKENKGIKQVVVEKLSIDEATRVSLLFEPKHHASQISSLAADSLEALELEESESNDLEKVFSLDQLENIVNEDFLKKTKLDVTAVPVEETKDISQEEIQNEVEPEEKAGKLKFSNVEESKLPSSKLKIVREESPESNEREVEDKKPLGLKLKTGDKEEKNLKYEKHTFTRKKAKSGHGFYYRAKDHVELYKVGSSFLKDFNSGLKSFSFCSSGLKEDREKSVLGILSFFNYHEDVNICVITSSLKDSFYSKIATKAEKREAQVFDEDLYYDFYTGDGFEVIEYQELKRVERKITAYNFEDFLDQIMGAFDLILWDLPELEVLDSNKELYFPIIRSLDNVSFIVGKNVSKISEINEMISYFKRYQIPIKGLLLSESIKNRGGKK